jgi:protein BCP1
MYRMLTDELKRAINDVSINRIISNLPALQFWTTQNEPYTFTHLLFISRTYHLTPDEESALFNAAPRANGANRKSKRSKQPSEPSIEPPADHIYSFHHEDEYIRKVRVSSLQ